MREGDWGRRKRGAGLGNERDKETEKEREGVGGDVDDEVDGDETEMKNTARRAEWRGCEEGRRLRVGSTGAGTGSGSDPSRRAPCPHCTYRQ